jgi:hypothetical protein
MNFGEDSRIHPQQNPGLTTVQHKINIYLYHSAKMSALRKFKLINYS